MKAYQLPRKMMWMLVAGMFACSAMQAQGTSKKEEKAAAIKAMVEAQDYVFHAQNTNPLRGRNILLTSEYMVKVRKDTVISDLPYFGRAYAAPIDPTKGGIQFTSTKFEYEVQAKKKSWEVGVKPKDAPDVQQFFLTIFNNGSATLQVTSTNRQPISFNGYVSKQ